MKILILFIVLFVTISCTTLCGGEVAIPNKPEECHKMDIDESQYCCYFEGKNLNSNENEKFCWAFAKTQIDDDKYKDVIKAIEKGTDSHVTKKHSDVKLDCYSFFEKLNYFLLVLLVLF